MNINSTEVEARSTRDSITLHCWYWSDVLRNPSFSIHEAQRQERGCFPVSQLTGPGHSPGLIGTRARASVLPIIYRPAHQLMHIFCLVRSNSLDEFFAYLNFIQLVIKEGPKVVFLKIQVWLSIGGMRSYLDETVPWRLRIP